MQRQMVSIPFVVLGMLFCVCRSKRNSLVRKVI